ncbi:REDY-like protein HapK [Altererythrobacter lutimaris]|uniref:REDY-like protein HapK n=1 Tax=Altererythrobacter lutimaris TaxID=2743979 RepID=A0A850HCY4_9SPHN|nr:REDY-like protein HapK [Altererythrobacter lutimaris]NVE95629.1 REDY-like protein HapK [Altererythrobacter lutimaris]
MRIIVPFNLKPGTDVAEYEEWAKTKDVPTASALPSVTSFTVHKATGLFGDPDTPSPYAYFEVLDITSMDDFIADISNPEFQEAAAPFQVYADAPQFILTEDL